MNDLRAPLEAAGLPSKNARFILWGSSREGETLGDDNATQHAYAIDAKAIAKVYVASRLAELADKEGGLMFDDFKSDGYETMGVWIGAKALLALLFPETP